MTLSNTLYALLLLFLIPANFGCESKGSAIEVTTSSKIKGVSFVAPPKPIDQTAFIPISGINANYISVIPYSFCPADSPVLVFNSKFQWWGERTEGAVATIEMARAQGLNVMLKPQVWLRHGTYTGELDFETTREWAKWEDCYAKYILHFAQLADSLNVEIFCIGTELKTSVEKRPEYWNNLIQKVRDVYHGKLTYAANWDDYDDVPFWSEIDYVGIDAYFPLSANKHPDLRELKSKWNDWIGEIKSNVTAFGKPVLFTEAGYRSAEYACKEPWVVERAAKTSTETQKQAYQALFETVWQEDWMAGMFLWKWFANDDRITQDNNDFSPQNKPAEEVISDYYAR